ncbi:response regulator [Waterburya agarophytonicola K14]|uniref:Response regulator n=1 Tax=Waterburya agarophytonicola KI4 TaxID=2874699 RepID=A0A964FHL2_9CYAN|nr:HD domain-containing phosphohydrolase [Waterburya agarophytonicola]MCC0177598.1 response regulator [Waterburya agarophytonicola KI4]
MKKVGEFPLATIGSSKMSNNSNFTAAKILIVDDNPHSRMTAIDLLSLDGYDVIEANNKLAILDSINKQQPDLILLDAIMLGFDSFAFCRQLKKDYRTANIPIVLTALSDSREYRIKVMEAGGDDILLKPLNRIELSTRVKSLINQKRLNDGLDQTEQVLFTIAKAVDNRSVNSGGSVRVASLVKSFAEYLGLTAKEIDDLGFAAHLHDIGTIAIPDAVMLKAGELTAAEKELIRQHVLIGEEICQPLRNRSGVLPIIRHHHERWDGTGYPDGLSGTDIPYLAQIFQIIDIYDALTSDRPHKKAYNSTEALKIIMEETTKGWRNPELITAFTSFIRSQKQ